MKQILQSYRTGELWLAEVPVPTTMPGGMLVRTVTSLVSAGTERMVINLAKKSLVGKAYARPDLVKQVIQKVKTEGISSTVTKVFTKLDTPIALGYSCAGIVTEVGEGVSGFMVGDRVACGGAGYATHAEVNFVPKNLCTRIPNEVSFEDASFTTIGSIALQGVRQAEVQIGERIVVIGLGLLGLLTVQILKANGCAVFGYDIDEDKCRLAKELGADETTASDLDRLSSAFTQGYGADAVIITASAASNTPLEAAAEISRIKGRIVIVGMVGMNVPRDPFYKKELELKLSMSYGPGRYDPMYEESGVDYPFGYVRWTEQRNMQSFLDLVMSGLVTPNKIISHQFDIDQALHAYSLLEGKDRSNKDEQCLGILLNYSNSESAIKAIAKLPLSQVKRTADIGIGFIGAGNYAKSVLLPSIKQSGRGDLIGICTASGMSASETGKKYEFSYATTDIEQILNDSQINTVFVVTQHNTHAKYTIEALKAGKHVFVEKPLCIKKEELTAYEEVLEELGKKNKTPPCLSIGFNRRYSPHARELYDVFSKRSSPLVVTYRINAGTVPKESWIQNRDIGGGRIVGEVCHFVDFCEYIIDSPPIQLFASCISSQDSRIVPEDSLVVTICYADGSLASIQYLSQGSSTVRKERIEMCADGITAITDDFRHTKFFGIKHSDVRGKQDKGVDQEVNSFLETVKYGGAWPISFDSMVRTTRVTFAIQEALRSSAVVRLE